MSRAASVRVSPRTIDDVEVTDDDVNDDVAYLTRERRLHDAQSALRKRLVDGGTLHEHLGTEMRPDFVLGPYIRQGGMTVIYGDAPVKLPQLGGECVAAVAEGPSVDQGSLRTASGREEPFGFGCHMQGNAMLVGVGPFHAMAGILAPLTDTMVGSSLTRFRYARYDSLRDLLSDLAGGSDDRHAPRFRLVVYDLCRLVGDQADIRGLGLLLAHHGKQDPLERPAVLFLVRTDVFRYTWARGFWGECDLVLLARDETAGHIRSREQVSLVEEVPPRLGRVKEVAACAASGGDAEPARGATRGRYSSVKEDVLCLAADGLAQKDIADRLKVSKSAVSRHLKREKKRLGVRGDDQLPLDTELEF